MRGSGGGLLRREAADDDVEDGLHVPSAPGEARNHLQGAATRQTHARRANQNHQSR